MIVIPAVDLRDGRCVQLVGGSYDRQLIDIEDPLAVALGWESQGFGALHLVDLDAATGAGSNAQVVESILESGTAAIQVGGGIRSTDRVQEVFAAGATRVVIGTRAISDSDWLEEVVTRYPNRVIVALDVRDRSIVTHGWRESVGSGLEAKLKAMDGLPLAALLVTAVHKEGLMQGPDVSLMSEVVRLSAFPVQAAGGISSVADIRALADVGVRASILGMALYTGAITATELQEVFAS
ncbi:MAG: 1-(5-phosphoribosyl)-5-[(5-phosphoribosylamino)methylideneamino]imidazole-4-carboxamide isomerase [Gemmatimonadota bacterium]|nr:1-(5-phosphoribosyl)-5-[(5-phosphoribosylamino)methylideneamino]imidazole-4-carboxamide isomerase [Gemmatimonadota bacterium]